MVHRRSGRRAQTSPPPNRRLPLLLARKGSDSSAIGNGEAGDPQGARDLRPERSPETRPEGFDGGGRRLRDYRSERLLTRRTGFVHPKPIPNAWFCKLSSLRTPKPDHLPPNSGGGDFEEILRGLRDDE